MRVVCSCGRCRICRRRERRRKISIRLEDPDDYGRFVCDRETETESPFTMELKTKLFWAEQEKHRTMPVKIGRV